MSETPSGEVDQSDGGIDRRSFAFGSLSTLAVVGGLATIGASTDPGPDTDQPGPSSKILSAEASVYDERAGMCGIDLLLDVGDGERVVIQNDFPGDSDRTVENSGERMLRTVVREDSTILIYAVDLDANTSKRLNTYHVSEDCTLSEVDDDE